VVSITPLPLYPRGINFRYQLNRGLRGPHSRSRRYEEEKNLMHLPEFETEPLGRPSDALLAIPSELSRLPGKGELSNSKSFLQIIAVYCSRRFCAICTSNCSQNTTVQAENSILYVPNLIQQKYVYLYIYIYRMSQKERSIFWEVIAAVILSINVYMYMCPIPHGFRDRAISLYSTLYTV
jgi:hypothetical protein